MPSSTRVGDMQQRGRAREVTVKYGRPRDTDDPAGFGWEDAEVTVREWENAEGVDVWLPDHEEALSLSWVDVRGLTAALALADLPGQRM